MRLHDKVIIVTGSTTGIGEAIARRCVAEGARVLIHGRDRERGEQLTRELGQAATLHIDDIADPTAPQRLVGAALNAFGKLDGLVNNAAYIVRSNLETTDADLFDRVMAINARAPMLMIKAAIVHLKRSQGAVVNIGSINAYTGEARQLAYSMSKAALLTMSRNLANVLAVDHVRVNHFNVGWVITPNEYKLKMKEGLPEGWSDRPELEHVPTGRMTQPEEIAAHAVFWLSDESRPISGSVIDLEQYPIIGRIPLKEGQSGGQIL
jgi:NAD(P)-dependent dehydrogenase (short-subunit alcohol dehydrogenase family)